jgi:hypothetical protein
MSRKKTNPIDITDDSALPRKNEPMQLGQGMAAAITRNGYAGTGDLRPPVYRPGSDAAAKLPSRIGNRLHYPDGRVELVGVQKGGAAECTK